VRDRMNPRTRAIATTMPHGGGQEVLHRQAHHLDQVAIVDSPGVVLPVRVSDERGGRVSRPGAGGTLAIPSRQQQVVLQPPRNPYKNTTLTAENASMLRR